MARQWTGRRRDPLMKRGEIWLVGLDPSEGHEQKGRRPVLIVSPEAFNHVTKVPVVLPITSGGSFARTAGFAVPLTGAGTKTTGVVRVRSAPRAGSPRTRRQETGKRSRARSWMKCWRSWRRFLSELRVLWNFDARIAAAGPDIVEDLATWFT